MKRTFLTTLILTTLAFALSAQPVTIKGKIPAQAGKNFLVMYGRVMDTVIVAQDGTFEVQKEIADEKGVIDIFGVNGLSKVSATKGATIEINTTKKGFQFSGYNANYNTFLANYRAIEYGLPAEEVVAFKNFKKFKSNIDKRFKKLERELNGIEEREEIEELKNHLATTKELIYVSYNTAHKRINGSIVENDKNFVAYMEGLNMNDRRVLEEPPYQPRVASLIESRVKWEIERNPEKFSGPNDIAKLFRTLPHFVSDKDILNHFAVGQFEMYLSVFVDEHIDAVYNEFKKIALDTEKTAEVTKKYNEVKELVPGKFAPDFALVDVDGNKIMLSDLRGKNIYIDVWATWCGPCVAEIPFVEKLQEKHKNSKNLEFVSISVDDDVKAWEKKLAEDKPVWKNYITEGGFGGPTYTLYHISGIPRFMMIDKEGKIVTVNAPRPSDKNIEQFLAPYL